MKKSSASPIYLLFYVDDILIAAKNATEIQNIKFLLIKEYEMKDLGATSKILGMEILRDRGARTISLSQKGYIEKILSRFNMKDSTPVSTPLAAHFKLSSRLCPNIGADKAFMSKFPYTSAVGSLMYAMICTRPDLSHAVSVVSKYMANLGKEHWKVVQWIFRYLRGTSDKCLHYGGSNTDVVGFVDFDYADDLDKSKSLTGYVFTVGGTAISWKATLQHSIALSTTEAEYMALAEVVKEAIWLRRFFGDFL